MSNRSNVLGVARKDSALEKPLAAPKPQRRIRLVKAMVATGRAMEAQLQKAGGQPLHARTCRLSSEDEARLEMLKRRLTSRGIQVKKSQLLRAALLVLAELDELRLREAVQALDDGQRVAPERSN